MTVYGYARVSTDGQTLASQDAQLHAAGCAKVYSEKASGARTDRPELAKLLRRLDEGDVLMVTRLDRLARSTRDLLNILDTVAKAGAGFKSLADAWADTTTAHGRLMLTVLGGLAEFERALIVARTGDGRVRAKARGVRIGGLRSRGMELEREAKERAEGLRSVFGGLSGLSARKAAEKLNADGVPTSAGGKWHATQVIRVRERLSRPA
jgi:DNA invertase Pin-like site-specific DNA recombinase